MKYYVIAGEPSGDLHASNMMKELLLLDNSIEFRFWGGDLMEAVTHQKPRKHIKDLAFMGFVEVAKNIRTIFKNIAFCKQDILDFKPEILILVDYPGFNLRIADWAKQQGVRVFYYISPTIWAWKEDRVEIIKRSVEKMFVILPFEVAVYKKHGYEADYAGHPLLDAIEQEKATLPNRATFIEKNNLDQRPIIAVLPGSRKQEIERMFSIMLDVVNDFKEYQFVIAGTTNLPKEAYQMAIDMGLKVVFSQTYALMHNAHAGIIKSGTSTLESALFRLPQVVCYKGGTVSYSIAKMVVGGRVKYIGLPNLILDKPVVKELIQTDLTAKNLKEELTKIISGPVREEMLKEYDGLIKLLGNSGASKKVAELMYNHIHAKNNIIIISVLFLFASWHVMDMPVESFHSSVTKNAVVNVSKKYAVDETVNIKIFSQIKVQSFTFSAEAGAYSIWANGVEVATTKQSPLIKLTYVNDSVEVKTFENVIGKYKRVKISSPDFIKSFRMKLISPDRKPRFYEDNLYVTTELGDLKCLNEISLDNYIAGVVQAESGRRSFQEFYKVQAILARTFALSHLQKHAPEGFNLCDHTHCQAYFGKTTELDIMKAVTDTKGKVVVDDNLNLIDAAFHSNSGGQTANSEDVWGSKLSYLRSVNDTFSTKMPNAKWERKMAKEDWLSYLKLKHNYPIQDSNARWLALTFKQDSRKPFLEANNVRVPLKNVRTDLQLKSTFFSVVAVGDTVIFKGKGFGHGVGMCQEGAMRMAKLGYKCPEVINFYYQKTQLIDLHKLNFFKDE